MLAEAHMVVYLKGVSSTELGFVADFMYNGEAFVSQDKLELFLDTAIEMKVKGLLNSDDTDNHNVLLYFQKKKLYNICWMLEQKLT